jgi:hypothetical protein
VTVTKAFTICQTYHSSIQPLHHYPLSSSPPMPAIVSTGVIFHVHTGVQCLHYIHPPTLFSPHPPPFHW